MTEANEKYSSVDELMEAVKAFVDAHKNPDDLGCLTGFSINVFLNRGVHVFELSEEVGKAARNVMRLEKQLEEAKKKLEIEAQKSTKKRVRGR
jgi:hypothetical protein